MRMSEGFAISFLYPLHKKDFGVCCGEYLLAGPAVSDVLFELSCVACLLWHDTTTQAPSHYTSMFHLTSS